MVIKTLYKTNEKTVKDCIVGVENYVVTKGNKILAVRKLTKDIANMEVYETDLITGNFGNCLGIRVK